MPFDIVVAHDIKNGIGINNTLPWECPPDMAYFKKLTINSHSNQQNTVIMGRKTWESIPERFRPLPKRTNIVVSNTLKTLSNATIATSLSDALNIANPDTSIFVIGGAQIYQEALNHYCQTPHEVLVFLFDLYIFRFVLQSFH